MLRAALFHCHRGFGFGGRRRRHPLGEHNLREGESPAPRGCWGCQLLGREVRQIKGRGAAWDAVPGGDGSCLGRAPGLFRVLLCLQASLQGCVQPRRGCSSTPHGYTHGHGNFRGGLGYKWAGVFSKTDPVPLHLPDAYGNPTAVVWLRFLMHQHSNCVRAQCSPLLLLPVLLSADLKAGMSPCK